jgi:hypothetical protein
MSNANVSRSEIRKAGKRAYDRMVAKRRVNDAVRLANAALEQLVAAISATKDDSDLDLQLNEAARDLESAIGYMTAVPEIGYLGQAHSPGAEA